MTSDSKQHFEILAHEGNNWVIKNITSSKQAALNLAKNLSLNAQRQAVKILRENTYGSAKATQTVQIFYAGQTDFNEKSHISEGERLALCRQLSDLYSYEGRRVITDLLQNFLKRQQITTTELLHHLPHYHRLEAENQILQSCVQRAAIRQVEGSSDSVRQRIRQIFDLIGQAALRLSKKTCETQTRLVEAEQFSEVFARLGGKRDRVFQFRMVLAKALAGRSKFPAKFPAKFPDKFLFLIEIIEGGAPQWAIEAIDPFLSEVLSLSGAITNLFPHVQKRGEALSLFYRLQFNGDASANLMIAAALGRDCLSQTRVSIENLILSEIASPLPLAGPELMEELSALQALWQSFGAEVERNNDFGRQLTNAFSKKSETLLTVQRIDNSLEALPGPLDRLECLARLESFAIGAVSRRRLACFIEEILSSHHAVSSITAPKKNGLSRLLRLALLQWEIEASDFEALKKGKYVTALDEVAYGILIKHKPIDVDLLNYETRAEQAIRLLELNVDGYFCTGQTSAHVRQKLNQLLCESQLTDLISPAGLDAAQQKKQLHYLTQLLEKSGFSEKLAS